MIRQESLWRQFVAMFGAFLLDDVEAIADRDRLDGVDAHQRMRQVGVEAIVDRLAEPDRNTLGDD